MRQQARGSSRRQTGTGAGRASRTRTAHGTRLRLSHWKSLPLSHLHIQFTFFASHAIKAARAVPHDAQSRRLRVRHRALRAEYILATESIPLRVRMPCGDPAVAHHPRFRFRLRNQVRLEAFRHLNPPQIKAVP
ncbi:hypothetical protein MRS44_003101 [Fusarium solani]|uniref:uncharacterized protein n=1 Tax=Fusarium solani TaxID=169388 RepID=UPI0032C3D62C|nr:hypothetical protein MRS44_003101 [Fusarium solani]